MLPPVQSMHWFTMESNLDKKESEEKRGTLSILLGIIRCFSDLDFSVELKDSKDRSNAIAKLEAAAVVKEWPSLLIGW